MGGTVDIELYFVAVDQIGEIQFINSTRVHRQGVTTNAIIWWNNIIIKSIDLCI